MSKQYLRAREVAEVVGVSEGKGYEIIRMLNAEPKAQGYITVPGRVPIAYFEKKYYGLKAAAGE